ncbi:MAG: ketoacyl-ACP synthase III [Streptococcaceae bacterium]|jgi:3-oxoacyl-[acyl-carrier-protein] synthase-3|nr:ketoacyl-ACP synthase III [Streptococcaceae bacterium]
MTGYTKILAMAHAVPEKIVTNDDLAQIMDTSDEWIRSRTGIAQRHLAADNETTTDFAAAVAEKLLTQSKISAEQLDFIIVATMTADSVMPSTAAKVQAHIGAVNAFAYDLTAACSGFVFALAQADKLISSGASRCGLVIGAETMSSVVDWSDRSTAVLFGDGAAGLMLDDSGTAPLILAEKLQTDGTRADKLTCFKNEFLKMDGRAIFDFALRDVPKNIMEVTADAEVDYFLLHQANARILDKMAKKLGQPREKFLQNLQHYGNTSAASVPLLLSEMAENGVVKEGQTLLLSGFGGGLTWGSLLIQT